MDILFLIRKFAGQLDDEKASEKTQHPFMLKTLKKGGIREIYLKGLLWWSSGKDSAWQCRRHRFQSLVQEDPTCHRATKPMCHNYWACILEPRSCNYWAHVPQLLKPTHRCPTQSPCPQTREATTMRSPHDTARVAPAHHNQRKLMHSNEEPA